MLKTSLSEIATFQEVLTQSDQLESKMKDIFEQKRQENYSAGYFFSVGLLQQLKEKYFISQEEEEPVSSQALIKRWNHLADDFRHRSGDDFIAKWDVFAECLIRLPSNRRFVEYHKVEIEQVNEMSEEVDTLESQKSGVPKYILEKEIQILPMIEEQIETRKMNLEEERVQHEIAS